MTNVTKGQDLGLAKSDKLGGQLNVRVVQITGWLNVMMFVVIASCNSRYSAWREGNYKGKL